MKRRLFNDKWLFLKTSLETDLSEVIKNKGDFMKVCLPHDHLIFDGNNLYEDCIGWYKRILSKQELKESSLKYKDGEKVFLWFDGVYMDSTVYANGKEIFTWKYGYSSFYVDITDYISDESLEIMVKVIHQNPNSRWYSGAGIYRDVYLFVADKTYIPFGGTYFHTEKIEGSSDYRIYASAEVSSYSEKTTVKFSLIFDDETVAVFPAKPVRKDGKALFTIENTFSCPKEWDVENPQCYILKTDVIEKDTLVDEHVETVGFKDVRLTTDEGLFLNGRHIKLNGVCEHHDFGCIGSSYFEDAMIRKFTLLRKMGVNAIRTSHNMPSSNFMELADRMGMLVVSEAFDMWERPKTDYDYARFFKDWVNKDVDSWVKRDRNHPSILFWSIGNEISDTHAGSRGYEVTKMLMDMVEALDPLKNGRVTLGSNYMPWENTQKCADLYKVAGYNYAARYYKEHHKMYPDWYIYGSETASIVMSRGVYHFPFGQSVLSDDDEQCSALGNSTTSWGAKSVEDCIADDRDVAFSLGQFLWTGFDYIGEPTPYHTRNSYFGQMDTAGFPKDSYYVFMAEWTSAKTNPMVHIFPYWDFNEGQIIDLRVCSNGAKVKLLVNGKIIGEKSLNHSEGRDFTATWQLPYEKGEITVIAYDEDGREIASESRRSFSNPVSLTINKKIAPLKAGGRSLAFIEISALDKDGNSVENAMDYVDVSVEGAGYLWGLDNGDSTDFDEYKCNRRKLFNGKLLAVVISSKEAGIVKVTASAEGLLADSVEIAVEESEQTEGCPTADTLDFEAERILKAKTNKERIPARKVELIPFGGRLLNKENDSSEIEAILYPNNSTDTNIDFKAVNSSGIEVDFVSVIKHSDNDRKVTVKALGDGDFYLRALSKDSEGKVRLISHLEMKAQGLGQAYMNPYKFVTGGLYTEEFGGIGNGNDKGFATSSDGVSGVVFRNLDFGEVGSDEITLPIFTFSNDGYPFKLYEGSPLDGKVIYEGIYQKNYIWNVYQEETFKLPKRLKGVTDLGISFDTKVHVKGFIFKKFEKAYEVNYAASCAKIYGDSFVMNEESVTNIGNNVTLEFDEMDFSEKGISGIRISGKSKLECNTIHIQFIDEKGTDIRQIVEFEASDEYIEREFSLNNIQSRCKVRFVFLPGSQFDFEFFRFF